METKIVVVTYGFDYEHVHTLGVYSSRYFAKKAVEANEKELDQYHYVSYTNFVLNETFL